MPPLLNLVTGRLKGDKPDESAPRRRRKRARLGLDGIASSQGQEASQPSMAFAPADWTPTQDQQDFTAVSANVDPGLAMPQGN